MKHYILPALAALLGLSACSSDIDTTDGGAAKVPVTVNATIGSPFTRTTPLDDETAFANGDKISVSNGDESKIYTLAADGTWSTDGENIGAAPLATTTFEAYYPVKDGNSYESGRVETDQNMTDLSQSDFMTASTPLNLSESHTLNLSFERKTAKVTVNIVGYMDEMAEEDRHISSVQIGANTNVGDKAATNVGTITMKKVDGSETQFVALVGPTTQADLQGKSDAHFLTLNFASGRAPLYANSIPTTLASGNSYTFNVTVGGDKLKVDDVTVTGFADGDTDGGMAEKTMATRLQEEIGDQRGKTFTVTGPWKDEYFSAIRDFARSHTRANMTVDLSQVTGLTSIPNEAFRQTYGLTEIILPPTIKSIGSNAFSSSYLKSINLPEGLTEIKYAGFYNAGYIESLILPSTYTSINDRTFTNMQRLKEIRFNGDVKKVGDFTFTNDGNLRSIYLNNCTEVPTVSNPFSGVDTKNITVYVKEDMLEKFKVSGWGNLGVNIVVAP